MSFVFVEMSHDYADEFDVKGAFVISKELFEESMEKIRAAFAAGKYENREFYFGTNEALTFDDLYSFESGVSVKECTEQFYDEFKQLTGGSIGTTVMDDLLDHANGHYDF
jgi:hypothetical protein